MELYRLTHDLYLRATPDVFGDSLGIFARGTIVEAVRINPTATWLNVRIAKTEGGYHQGWMPMRYLTHLSAATV